LLPLPLPLLRSRLGWEDNDKCLDIPENNAAVVDLFTCPDDDDNGEGDGEEVEVEEVEEERCTCGASKNGLPSLFLPLSPNCALSGLVLLSEGGTGGGVGDG